MRRRLLVQVGHHDACLDFRRILEQASMVADRRFRALLERYLVVALVCRGLILNAVLVRVLDDSAVMQTGIAMLVSLVSD